MADTPQHVGKYPVERLLGRGGMGEVWLARNPDLDIPVAIKTLPSHLSGDGDSFVSRFLSEARTAARLNHENVVRTHDAGTDDGRHYIVMEHVGGGSVRQLQEARGGALSPAEAVGIVTSVARGLEAAAKLSIVHRDIKPDNILLDEDGTPKLADLGLAKQAGQDGADLTGTGMSIGTPGYIAPEQALDSKRADARADIYSLGATLYHLVTGRQPFVGESAFSIMMKHVNEPLVSADVLEPELPGPLARLIDKMMAKDPDDRHQTASELVGELEALGLTSRGPSAPTLPRPTLAESPSSPEAPTEALAAPAPATMRPLAFRRFLGGIVDVFVTGLLGGLVPVGPDGFWLLFIPYAGLTTGWRGRTLGQWAAGLRTVNQQGGRLGWGGAFLRAVGCLVSALPVGLGFLWALFDRHGETFHDKIARSMVVRAARR
ncbi:MAG: protein kinase [Acidobacteriota bacterium]